MVEGSNGRILFTQHTNAGLESVIKVMEYTVSVPVPRIQVSVTDRACTLFGQNGEN